jgi:hypothetical protein
MAERELSELSNEESFSKGASGGAWAARNARVHENAQSGVSTRRPCLRFSTKLLKAV